MTFLNQINKYKNRTAVIDRNQVYTYSDLIKESKKITQDIKSRSLVFLLSSNNVETILYYIGLINKKAVVVILNQNINSNNLKNLLIKYKPNYLILDKNYPLKNNYKILKIEKNYKILVRKKIFEHKIFKDLGILLSTSGTTGNPKFVRLSYQNYFDNSESIIKSIKLNQSDSVVTTLPISYTYGLSIINTFLISGAKIILNKSSILEKKFWDVYREYKPSHFYGVPFIFEILFKLNFKNLFTKKLKTIALAGGKASEETLKNLIYYSTKNKIKFYNMYGQTEASPRMSLLDYRFNLKKINSIGKPVKGGKFILISNKGKQIRKPFTEGEIIYFGKNVCLGYAYSYRDLKNKNDNNFKLLTGDIGFFDKEKFFYISGRKKRFIKLFGNRISLDDIEKMINKKGYDCACENMDNKIKINYNNKKFNKNSIKKELSNQLNVNQNFIEFAYVKKFKKNKLKTL